MRRGREKNARWSLWALLEKKMNRLPSGSH